ncbi:hypothetical protein SEA_SKOG_205 [Gordonia phage Skog]|uniref:Uncharacterized protein n=1 Tax=Gordonia phage Skog TaxID=2704033 RepID=A0A6G6XJW7_9CAUD|nr:hypothetical protein KHQ85_gp205 [Gordonia phage Skog]QIG58357.1 hypothetical protein SEA_SKOG_205 [Gordonia phage Skog]
MSFVDPDSVEKRMGVRVEKMTPDQLVCYVGESLKAHQGLNTAIDGMRERAVFRGLQSTYGKENAGRIVKWAFYRYQGKWDGEIVGFFSFTKGRKWWNDRMFAEMQQQHAVDETKAARAANPGARTVEF